MPSPAVTLIDEGNALEAQGHPAQAMARYDAAVQADPRCARAHLNRGNLLLGGGRIDEARAAYQRAIECDPHYAGAHYNLGNLNAAAGELTLALANFAAAIALKPDFADAFVALANAQDALGRPAEAVASYQRALEIHPGYAEVHFNLGALLLAHGRSGAAVESLRKATELRPDYAPAHDALGVALTALGRCDEAEASLRRALTLAPGSEEILHHLVAPMRVSGRMLEAARLILDHFERHAPSWRLKTDFAHCITSVRFTAGRDPGLRAALTAAFTEPWAGPIVFRGPALSLVMLTPEIAAGVRLVNEQWPQRLSTAVLSGSGLLAKLAADRLLRAVLVTVPVTTPEFERFLTAARAALLESAAGSGAPGTADPEGLEFYGALAQQCFINEYIFDLEEAEAAAADRCRARLLALLDAGATVPPLLLLAVAAYSPLGTLPQPQQLLTGEHSEAVAAVLRQQVSEPLEERALRALIVRLTPIGDGVSQQVREQYEENPYPRWVKLPRHDLARRFNEDLRLTFPMARFTPLEDDSSPQMLIAGCGTGSQPILAATRYRDVRALAVDLSLSSLGYAMRKTRELGIAGIEYAQADIVHLGTIGRTFDIIASIGVLHHLADPFAGWRTLLSLLKPGGFMQLGFYSELARRHIVAAREIIAARGYTGAPQDIRRFRRELRDSEGELRALLEIPDFYSMSDCRDLLFHVQEHRLTLGQIAAFLADNGLEFLGFELPVTDVLHQYRKRFSDDPAATDLRNWARFEADNPGTFLGMYQFWVQKPHAA